MKAIVFDRTGPASEVLTLRSDLPIPTPARGEVLVRMLMSPINPSDLMYISGRYGLQPRLPATPGFEGVGVVEANGGGILGWLRKGKRVAVVNAGRGDWAEYTLTSSRLVIPIPDAFSDEQGATFFVNPATALAMTQHVLRVPRNAWVMQSAAGSEVGKMIIRLGRKYGFRTVNIVRRRELVGELKSLGADIVLVDSDGPIAEQVASATSGANIAFAVDPVGGSTASEMIAALGDGGRCLLYGSLSEDAVSLTPRHLLRRNIRIEGFWLGHWAEAQPIRRMLALFRQMRQLINEGTLATTIANTFPIDDFAAAIRAVNIPGRGGKVILRIGK